VIFIREGLLERAENDFETGFDQRQFKFQYFDGSLGEPVEKVVTLGSLVRLGRVISLSLARVALGLVAGRVAGLWVVLVVVGLDCDD
jgi:hypothetical protein